MLIALITILFLGGASTGILDYIADTRDAVKQVMPKGEEQKAALTTLKAMKKRSNATMLKVARKSTRSGTSCSPKLGITTAICWISGLN